MQYLFNHRDQIALKGRVLYMRSFVHFAGPLDIDGKRYNDLTDGYKEQKKKIADFQIAVKDEIVKEDADSPIKTMFFSLDVT